MKYTFHYNNPNNKFLDIDLELNCEAQDSVELQLPAWRPGRYELGNFAKNIQKFNVTDENGKDLCFTKKTKDSWFVGTRSAKSIKVSYNYYAAELNAGSTWIDEKQLYVNPVNCCVYDISSVNEQCEIEIKTPYPFEEAIGLPSIGDKKYNAENFHELTDSPFISSPTLQHEFYEIDGYKFNIWFQGEVKPHWSKLQMDFEAFTRAQLKAFGEFPCEEYHFLFQISPFATYHGVEHKTTTVITLGPSYDIFNKLYTELLGVSSHELYHAWNVKSIRPVEMVPYDYTKENYSKLGFVYEGVTTYMGDQFLLRSGVFNDSQYFKEIGDYITRHLHNGGRFNMSVADSSFDTWLDGYVQGIPNRKTSIYTEGCLFSFILDVEILLATDGEKSLDNVMKQLYEDTAKKGWGFSLDDYRNTINAITGKELNHLFNNICFSPVSYEKEIVAALTKIGLTLVTTLDTSWSRRFGLKGTYESESYKVMATSLKSDAANINLQKDDLIVAVNGYGVKNDLDKWLEYFGESQIEITIKRGGQLLYIPVDAQFENGYSKHEVKFNEDSTEEEKKNYEIWKRNGE